MKQKAKDLVRFSVCLFLILAANVGLAQNANDSERASTNVSASEYPRILPDLRVIFSVKAPEARKVQIQLDKLYDLQRDEQGTWLAKTEPQVPGFHYYSLIIDGVAVADPASETFYGMSRMASGIEIPEKGIDFYTVKDVPHGDVRSKQYYSMLQVRGAGCLFTHPQIMIPTPGRNTRCCIFSMVAAKTKGAGSSRGKLMLSWIT